MDIALIICAAVLGLALILFLLFVFLVKPNGRRRGEMEKYKNVRYAHRGLHGDGIAENSLSAFRAAVEGGYGIELDVRLSKDGVLVVFHDDTLDRVTEESGPVRERSFAELSEIKLSGTDDTVPSFKEVLELVGGRVPLLVELKEDQGSYAVSEAAVEMLREYNGDYIIESFNPLSLARVKKLAPEVLRGILSHHFYTDEKYRGFKYFLLQNLCLNFLCKPDFIAYNYKHAYMPAFKFMRLFRVARLAWTAESEEADAVALERGFDGVIFQFYRPKVRTDNKENA